MARKKKDKNNIGKTVEEGVAMLLSAGVKPADLEQAGISVQGPLLLGVEPRESASQDTSQYWGRLLDATHAAHSQDAYQSYAKQEPPPPPGAGDSGPDPTTTQWQSYSASPIDDEDLSFAPSGPGDTKPPPPSWAHFTRPIPPRELTAAEQAAKVAAIPWWKKMTPASIDKENAVVGAALGAGSIGGTVGGVIGGAVGGPAGAAIGSVVGRVAETAAAEVWNSVSPNYSKADLSAYLPDNAVPHGAAMPGASSTQVVSLLQSMQSSMRQVAEVGVRTTSGKANRL